MKFSVVSALFFVLVAPGGPNTFASALSTHHIKPAVVERSVWAPAVLSPKQGDLWKVGSTQTVVWDTQNPPSQVTNPKGKLLLGYLDGSGSENLDSDRPLAQGFDLRDGHINVVVPNVPRRDTYVVALIGDSGNISPKFTISA